MAIVLLKARGGFSPQGHEPRLPAYREAIRDKLANLAVIRREIEGQRRAIRQAAEGRLSVVQREIDAERAKVHLDDDAAARYRALILERGRLHRLLS